MLNDKSASKGSYGLQKDKNNFYTWQRKQYTK